MNQSQDPTPTRAGYVTLLGRPNSGKSTFLNGVLGEKLSIVTAKAQTTWQRVTGIHTAHGAQMIFLDTPGVLDPRDLFQKAMLGAAEQAVLDADVIILFVDTTRPKDLPHMETVRELLQRTSAPLFVALNKIDVATAEGLEKARSWAEEHLPGDVHGISALDGSGVGELLAEIREHLPEGPFLFPEDDIASAPVRFFVQELVRETVFERFKEEVPYSVFCQVEEFREGSRPVYIQVNVFVERNSQKRILIGDKGRAIRELGRAARKKIEEFIGQPVYLDLWVKVLPGWTRKRNHLQRLGFRVPTEHGHSSP